MNKEKSTTFVYPLDGNLYINLTNRCGNDCNFCLRKSGGGVKDSTLWLAYEPSADEVTAQIKAADFSYSEAVFCGYGESTYRLDELCEVAAFLKAKDIKVRLNTNGLGNLINKSDIVPRLKEGIDSVSISLNAADAESYYKLCRPVFGAGAYGEILAFAKKCVNAGIVTTLTAVDIISKEELDICEQTAQKIGAKFKIRAYISDNKSYT